MASDLRLSVYVCACVCAGVHVCTCMWRPENKLVCHSAAASHLVL